MLRTKFPPLRYLLLTAAAVCSLVPATVHAASPEVIPAPVPTQSSPPTQSAVPTQAPVAAQAPLPAKAPGEGPAVANPNTADPGAAAPPPALTGREIAERVDARDEGNSVRQELAMTLMDKSGSTQERQTLFLAKGKDNLRRTVIYFNDPAKLKGTAFLTYDYKDAEDAQWLYLPAVQRSRRVSASDRGSYFLGTDFTYEDMKKQTKLSLEDFTFEAAGEEVVDGARTLIVNATPINEKTASELGYGKVRIAVDPRNWVALRAEYWDTNLNPLKTTYLYDITKIDGIITPLRIICKNHKSGHQTEFRLSNIKYEVQISDEAFTEQALRQGSYGN